MALALLQNQTAVKRNIDTPFKAVGGVEPYVYSVVPGGVGGVIDVSSGLYTSPLASGRDTIKVIDAAMEEITAQIYVGNPIELVCEIIRKEMGLTSDQVYLYQQKIKVPPDSRIYIAVGILSSKPFATMNRASQGSGLREQQSLNMQVTLSIDIMSRSLESFYRKEDVLFALASTYSESQQQANSFQVARLPASFVNLSEEEGAAIPYRFNLSVNMQYSVSKEKAISYFDQFEESVVTVDP